MITKEQAVPGTKVTFAYYGDTDYQKVGIVEGADPLYADNVLVRMYTHDRLRYKLNAFPLQALNLYEEPVAQPDFSLDGNAESYFEEEERERYLAESKANAQFLPIKQAFDAMEDLMRWKNQKYGNSGLGVDPIVAPPGENLNKLLARLDDKLQRWRNHVRAGGTVRKEDVADMIGYGMLILADQQWYDLEDQKQ